MIGRFLSADTIIPDPANPQAFNRYNYCLNNPLKYVDPSGYQYYDWYMAILVTYQMAQEELPEIDFHDPDVAPEVTDWQNRMAIWLPIVNDAVQKIAEESQGDIQSNEPALPTSSHNRSVEGYAQDSNETIEWGKVIAGTTIIVVTDLTLGILTVAAAVFAPPALAVMIPIDETLGTTLNVTGVLLINEGLGGWSFTGWVKSLFD